jgi:hypothetical protein
MKRHNIMKSHTIDFYLRFIIFFILLFVGGRAFSGNYTKHIELQWTGTQPFYIDSAYSPIVASFTGAVYDEETGLLPMYNTTYRPSVVISDCKITCLNAVYRVADDMWQLGFAGNQLVKDTIEVHSTINEIRKMSSVSIWLIPLRLNSVTGHLEQLVSFDLEFDYKTQDNNIKATTAFSTNSVLATGDWYKLELNKAGIYRITYTDIQNMGVNMQSINPANIRIYGNPGGMLPQANSKFRYDDLQENAIRIVSVNPGIFAPGDYILFYGTSPVVQSYNILTHRFEHVANCYSDKTCYFLNFDHGPGKRIGVSEQSTQPSNHESARFTDYIFYENDLYNLIQSGTEWMGERLDNLRPAFDVPLFSFPNADLSVPALISYGMAGKADANASFKISVNGSVVNSPSILKIDSEYLYARYLTEKKSVTLTVPQAQVNIQYILPNTTAKAWIDYVDMNVVRQLIYTGGQMPFADPGSVGKDFVTKFTLSNASANLEIWEVTDPLNVHLVNMDISGSNLEFTINTDSLRRFIAADQSQYFTASYAGKVPNQNLHARQKADMVIVVPEVFLSEAQRLADFHTIHDNLLVAVVTLPQIYNEFSSGAPDATAIRDFMRMLYDRAPVGETPRYLLLFGDGSYDNKNRIASNTNLIPTFQTKESLIITSSYATDDYFGIYGNSEGNGAIGSIDIGIGRFPVVSAAQAKTAVDKTIYYAQNSPGNLGDWRNTLCFVADDEDGDTHLKQAEQLCNSVWTAHKEYNINKIYLDAFKQESFPGGARYPTVNDAINQQVEKGALLVNYTGHGGEVGWAHERVLEVSDINSWNNIDEMPVFITATCSFSRFDDPGRVSAGEQVFLNPVGGGVALFTTSRIANAGSNVELNQKLYDTIFSSNQGVYPRLGDVMSYSKNENPSAASVRNFVLLGDPAIQLAYPENKVVTTSVNSGVVSALPDTVRALSKITLSGIIEGGDGTKLDNFNGEISVKVFDKPSEITTLSNDPKSPPWNFLLQKNILYQGKATVLDGDFSISFIVPKDIDYKFGSGKISYYAENGTIDAGGYYDNILIGGDGTSLRNDTLGPVIKLYLNDRTFESGDIVGENPILLAYMNDSSGINTVGNGIGHDIVAVLDGNTNSSIVLNDYYQADLDNYQKGTVRYHFFDLTEGSHSLKLKAWDVYNNSSEAVINFVVSKSIQLSIRDVLAYPNPCIFSDPVKFKFTHNLFDNALEVKIDIFNLSGMLVKTIGFLNLESAGYVAGPVEWDGRDTSGNDLRAGMYIYRVRARDRNDVYAEKSGKIIIVR